MERVISGYEPSSPDGLMLDEREYIDYGYSTSDEWAVMANFMSDWCVNLVLLRAFDDYCKRGEITIKFGMKELSSKSSIVSIYLRLTKELNENNGRIPHRWHEKGIEKDYREICDLYNALPYAEKKEITHALKLCGPYGWSSVPYEEYSDAFDMGWKIADIVSAERQERRHSA